MIAFVDVGMTSSTIAVNVPLWIICASLRYIMKPILPALIICSLSRRLAKSKLFYIPIALNTILFCLNTIKPVCFTISEENGFVRGPLYFLGIIFFALYVVLLAGAYLTNSLITTWGQRIICIIILLLVPLAEIGETMSNRNVMGTSILIANILEYEMLIVLKNNLQLRKVEKDLAISRQASVSDDMTGLLNRRAYDQRLELEMSKEDISPDLTFVVCDINGLKAGNDTYGHETGDNMIIGAADCLRGAFRNYGDIYRIGGDEFMVIVDCDRDTLADRLNKLDYYSKQWVNPYVKELSLSKGVARVVDYPELDLPGIVKMADQKMYEDKQEFYRTHANLNRRRTK